MPTPSNKKKPSKKVTEDPLSSSGVSSLSGISAYNIRKISIYKNGDRFHRGVKFVINPRVVKDMEPLLNQINDRIELSHGAKKLYTTDGKVVNSIKELEDGKIYVAASAQFIPMRYGEFAERVWKPPSRKHSPIMSSDRIKTARTRSQEPGKREEKGNSAVQRSRSVRTLAEDRKSKKEKEKAPRVNGTPVVKKMEIPRPKAPANRNSAPTKSVPTAKKPPTPKRRIPQPRVELKKKIIPAAMGAGVAVVGAAAIATVKKTATPKTAVSDISTASSVIPAPNIESKAAEILEFPEEEKQVDVATIHRTPTPQKAAASRSASAKSVKSMRAETPLNILEAKSVSQQPTPESSEEEENSEEEEEASQEEEEEEDNESEEVEEPSDEEEEEEDESGVETPASRRSSASAKSKDAKND